MSSEEMILISLFEIWYKKQNLIFCSKENFIDAYIEFRALYQERSAKNG